MTDGKTKAKHTLIIGIIFTIISILIGGIGGYYSYKAWYNTQSSRKWWIVFMVFTGIFLVIGLILIIMGAAKYISEKKKENLYTSPLPPYV